MRDDEKEKGAANSLRNKKGDAMIVVVCLMFLFTALSLALLLSVSAVTGSLKKNASLTRCRLAAESFSEMLGKDLTDSTRVTDFQKNIKELLLSDKDFDFCWYQDKEGKEWKFTPQSENGSPVGETIRGYDITVTIYFGDIAGMDEQEATQRREETKEMGKYGDLFLYTIVTCGKGEDSCHIRQKYQISVIEKTGEEAPEWIFQKA